MRKLALVLVGLVLGILLAESVLHLSGHWPEISWEWQLYSSARVPDEHSILIHPHFREVELYDSGDAKRVIVALGDSFTEGYGVAPEASWPSLVEDEFRENGANVRVINMGLGNSGPQQQLRVLENHVLPNLRPDDVVWTFYANDRVDDRVQSTFVVREGSLVPTDASAHWIHRRLALWRSIPLPNILRKRSAILRAYIHVWEQREREKPTADRSNEPDLLELLLERAREQARAHGFRLWLVLITPEAAYLPEQDPDRPSYIHLLEDYDRLRHTLKEQPRFAEARYPTSGAAQLDPARIFLDPSRDPAYPGDHHFNEEGQRRLASQVYKLVASQP